MLAKNYIAKKYGVKTGEAIWEAQGKCPNLIIVRPNYSLYLRFSAAARDVYSKYTDQIESFGIDECWIDVTQSTRLFGTGTKIADEIRETIKYELGITCSIGVSYNKIFAKLGSDMKKPDATTVITEDNYKHLVWWLPVEELLYVGQSTKRKLNNIAVITIGDLANINPGILRKQLGKWGETLWYFANGFDNTPVVKTVFESIIKSIGNSLTTPRDLLDNNDAKLLLFVLSESVGERLRRHNLKGKTIQISITDTDLGFTERQAPLARQTYITTEIANKAYDIFLKNWDWNKDIRALGVRATNLVTADTYIQLSLFEDDNRRIKKEILDYSVDKIRERFGHYAVQRALLLKEPVLNANSVEENVIHPVSYFK